MQVVTFACGTRAFCIRITDVSEVLGSPRVLSLPRAPSDFDGVFQLRGRIITLLNFARCFDSEVPNSDSQIVVFAEPYPHFAIRVPGIAESISLEGATRAKLDESDGGISILEARLRHGEDWYHLISPAGVISHATQLVRSVESAV